MTEEAKNLSFSEAFASQRFRGSFCTKYNLTSPNVIFIVKCPKQNTKRVKLFKKTKEINNENFY